MKYDVAIIGNGVLALSTAFSLQNLDKNIKIALIGKRSRIGSASNAAGAMLNYLGEVTSQTLENTFSQKKLELSIDASKKWDGWLANINSLLSSEEQVMQRPGTFVILNGKSGTLDTDNYLAIMQAALKYNEPFEEVHPKEVTGLDPIEDSRPLRALYLPKEGSINSNNLVIALEKALSKFDNVSFIDEDCNIIEQNSKSTISALILTNGEKIVADKILLASGSYSQHFIDQLPEIKDNIPRLLSGVGVSAVVSQDQNNKISHIIRTPNRSGACGLHVLPRSDDSLYIGATNNIAFSPSVKQKMGLSQFLMQCAIDQINQNLYNSEILNWHVGNRPVTIDGFPLAGKTSIDNFYILTGTYRDGLQQSPFWADYMANIILNKDSITQPFTPERKLLKTLANKEASIAMVVEHYMAGFYEHGMKLARLFSEDKFESLLRGKFENIYSKLDTEFPLIPDMLFLFEISDDNDGNIAYFNEYFKNKNLV